MKVRYAFVIAVLSVLPVAAQAAGKAETLSQVFKRVGGAVVVVHTSEHMLSRDSREPRTESASALGSGVLISADGKVMTAAHVVQTADAVSVEFPGEKEPIAARIVAADESADVALLQLERVPAGAKPAALGDSDGAEVGDEVFIVGAPFGISHTLTVGHLSARRRENIAFDDMSMAELFQTDAAINQGNSGGPMFNMRGEVIGIVSHIVSRTGGFDGLGFVVTSNMARRLLLEEPSVWNGLEGYFVAGEMARALNLPRNRAGLLVQRVADGSPAARFGLRGGTLHADIGDNTLVLGGDVILAVEGIALSTPNAYEAIRTRLIDVRTAASADIHLVVLRNGELVELVGRFHK